MRNGLACLGLVLAIVALVGCSGGAASAPAASASEMSPAFGLETTVPTRTAQASGSCLPRYGVAGLIPAHYPSASADDWTAMYRSVGDTGGLLGVYTNWADPKGIEGAIPGVVKAAFATGTTYGFMPVVGLGFARDVSGGGVASTVDWSNAAQVSHAVEAAVAVARTYRPGFLGLGIEVNRLYESDPAGFDAFVAGYEQMYDQVKAASPGTLVFPVFQLEMTRGKAYLMGGKRNPEWDLLARFADRMDAAAFTTYPFFDAQSPADLPDDYFSVITAHTDKPIVFTEIGWPSAPLANAPKSGYGGTPEEQSAFVSRFFELTGGLDVRAALWSFPDDLNADYPNTAMRNLSLRTNDGTAKPALTAWQQGARTSCPTAG